MKKQPTKTVNPFFITGTNAFSGINPFVDPASQIPVLKIDTESRFSEEKKADPETKEG